jgi:hypothetical protein
MPNNPAALFAEHARNNTMSAADLLPKDRRSLIHAAIEVATYSQHLVAAFATKCGRPELKDIVGSLQDMVTRFTEKSLGVSS